MSAEESWQAGMLERLKVRAADENARSRQPGDELITTPVVTIADVYIGSVARELPRRLAELNIKDGGMGLSDYLRTCLEKDLHGVGTFIISGSSRSSESPKLESDIDLPEGVTYVYGTFYALGASTVCLVLSFVLDDSIQLKIDDALRRDAEPELKFNQLGGVNPLGAEAVKSDRIQSADRHLRDLCKKWVAVYLPGYLSTRPTPSPPSIVEVSLKSGVPLETSDGYMKLLRLSSPLIVNRERRLPALHFVYSISEDIQNNVTLAFNEARLRAEMSSADNPDLVQFLHSLKAPLLMSYALSSLVTALEAEQRVIQAAVDDADPSEMDYDAAEKIRIRILRHRRDLDAIRRDVPQVLNPTALFWDELPQLEQVEHPSGKVTLKMGTQPEIRKHVLDAMEPLKVSALNLNEQSAVISEAVSDRIRVNSDKRLGNLTKVLVVLTVVITLLAIVALFHHGSSSFSCVSGSGSLRVSHGQLSGGVGFNCRSSTGS